TIDGTPVVAAVLALQESLERVPSVEDRWIRRIDRQSGETAAGGPMGGPGRSGDRHPLQRRGREGGVAEKREEEPILRQASSTHKLVRISSKFRSESEPSDASRPTLEGEGFREKLGGYASSPFS